MSDLVVFMRRYKWSKDCTLTWNEVTLQWSNGLKYLGVTLDGELSWKSHLEKRYRGAHCHDVAAVGSSWDPRLCTMVWINGAILKPRLAHVALVWGKKAGKKSAEAALDKLRGLVLRRAIEAFGSKLIAVLGFLLDTVSLKIKSLCMPAIHTIGSSTYTKGLSKRAYRGNLHNAFVQDSSHLS